MNATYVADRASLMQDASGVASPSSQPASPSRYGSAATLRNGTEPAECVSNSRQWFVGRYKPYDGLQAVDRAKLRGFNAILPRQVVRRPQRDEVIQPVFVGYLFVEFDVGRDAWGELLQPTVGLVGLITRTNLQPAALPIGFVEQFMAGAGADGVFPYWWPNEPPASPATKIGRELKVSSGPWAGFVGRCTSVNRNKVALLLDIFGRSATVEFRGEQVGEVES